MKPPELMRRLIGEWSLFHGFYDDCGYPLISPSDIVLDDLVFRLNYDSEDWYEIEKAAKARWEALPWSKGKIRELRRKESI